MSVSAQQLMHHYASLSDEELQGIDPADLTDVAQKYYKEEIARRGILESTVKPQEEESGEADWTDGESSDGEPFVACVFTDDASGIVDSDDAYKVLKNAGIPCRIEVRTV